MPPPISPTPPTSSTSSREGDTKVIDAQTKKPSSLGYIAQQMTQDDLGTEVQLGGDNIQGTMGTIASGSIGGDDKDDDNNDKEKESNLTNKDLVILEDVDGDGDRNDGRDGDEVAITMRDTYTPPHIP